MRSVALAIAALWGSACNATAPTAATEPTARHLVYLLTSVNGGSLPALVAICDPLCSTPSFRAVVADTLTFDLDAESRFRWNVSYRVNDSATVQRIVVHGKLGTTASGFTSLVGDDHPTVPPSIPTGLLISLGGPDIELNAFPPWRTAGLTKFGYHRIE